MKLLIESKKVSFERENEKRYRLTCNEENIPSICLSMSFRKIMDTFHVLGNEAQENCGWIEETNLTDAFCKLSNEIADCCLFSRGLSSECKLELSKIIYNRQHDLEQEIEKDYYLGNSLINLRSAKKKAEKEDILSFYSKCISYLIYLDKIDGNYPIPFLFEDLTYKIYFDKYLSKDYYPIDLALDANNFELLKNAIINNYCNFTSHNFKSPINIRPNPAIKSKPIVILIYILRNIKEENDFSIFDSFIKKHDFEFAWIFLDVTKEEMRKSARNYDNGRGDIVMWEYYKACLRIDNTNELSKIIKNKYKSIYFCRALNCSEIFSPHIEFNEDNIYISNEMRKFIQNEVLPEINATKPYNYKEHGIWGYDAFSGAPIMESDLHLPF